MTSLIWWQLVSVAIRCKSTWQLNIWSATWQIRSSSNRTFQRPILIHYSQRDPLLEEWSFKKSQMSHTPTRRTTLSIWQREIEKEQALRFVEASYSHHVSTYTLQNWKHDSKLGPLKWSRRPGGLRNFVDFKKHLEEGLIWNNRPPLVK